MFWNAASSMATAQLPLTSQESPSPGSVTALANNYVSNQRYNLDLDPYNDRLKSRWSHAEAIRGNPPLVAEAVDVFTIFADRFISQVVLPEQVVDTPTYAFVRYQRMPIIAQRANEEGRYRIPEAKQMVIKGTLEKWVMGLDLPLDFMNTEKGVEELRFQLESTAKGYEDSKNIVALGKLLSTYSPAEEFLKYYNLYQGRRLYDNIRYEKETWDLVHRNPTPLEIMHTLVKIRTDKTRQNLPDFDLMLMHENTRAYLTQVPEMAISYDKAGPAGPERLAAGAEGLSRVGNTTIKSIKTYDYGQRWNTEILESIRSIGEWYHAKPLERGKPDSILQKYSSATRTIRIYDWEKSGFVELDLGWLWKNSHRINPDNGKLLSVNDPIVQTYQLPDDFPKEHYIDSLHMNQQDNEGNERMVPIELMGHMNSAYFTTKDLLATAKTMIQGSSLYSQYQSGVAKTKLIALRNLIAGMSGSYDHFDNIYLWLVARDNITNGFEEHPGAGGLRPLRNLPEWKPNFDGTLDFPTFDGDKLNESYTITFSPPLAANAAPNAANYVELLNNALDATPEFSAANVRNVGGVIRIEHPQYPAESIVAEPTGVRVFPRKVVQKHVRFTGFGNYYGLSKLSNYYLLYKKDEFERKFGGSYESAKTAHEGIEVIRTLVEDLRRMCPHSIALDSSYTPSWFHQASAEAVFFETLFHRQNIPAFLYAGPGLESASLAVPGYGVRAQERRSDGLGPSESSLQLFGLSQSVRQFITTNLIGMQDDLESIGTKYSTTMVAMGATGQQIGAATGANNRTRLIGADLSSAVQADKSKIAVFEPEQPYQMARDGLARGNFGIFRDELPPFARYVHAEVDKAPIQVVNGVNLYRVTVLPPAGAGGARPEPSKVQRAYNALVQLYHNLRPQADQLGRRTIEAYRNYSIVLGVFNALKLRDLQNLAQQTYRTNLTAASAEKLADRILAIYEQVVAPRVAGLAPDDALSEQAVAGIDINGIIAVFKAHVASFFGSAKRTLSPYKIENAAQLDEFVSRTFDVIKERAREQIAALTNEPLARAQSDVASYRVRSDLYRRSPLTLSVDQVERLFEFMSNKDKEYRRVPSVLPADPHAPEVPVAVGPLQKYVQLIKEARRSGNRSRLESLPLAYRPTNDSSSVHDLPLVDNVMKMVANNMGDELPESAKRSIEAALISELPGRNNVPIGGAVDLDRLNEIRAGENIRRPPLRLNNDGVLQPSGSPLQEARGKKRIPFTFGGDDIDESALTPAGYYDDRASIKRVRTEISGLASGTDPDVIRSIVTRSFAKRWEDVHAEIKDPVLNMLAKVFLLTPTRDENWQALIDNNVIFPVSFLLFRNDMRFLVRPVIWMVAGSQTGNILIYNRVATGGDSAIERRWKAKMTFEMDAAIREPANVAVIPNFHVERCIGGLTTIPHSVFSNADSQLDASIWVLAEPYTAGDYQIALSTTSKPEMYGVSFDELLEGRQLMYYNAWFYRQLYGFSAPGKIQYNEYDVLTYRFAQALRNTICFRGVTQYWNYTTDDIRSYCTGEGHYGTREWGPDFRKVLSGEMVRFETPFDYAGWTVI